MKAAIYQKPHAPLTIEDVELAELRSDEVLVRTVCSGVCHSDMHFVDGLWAICRCPRCWATRRRAWSSGSGRT